jgi:glycosyltransferase involved in cell wall biosynthesis
MSRGSPQVLALVNSLGFGGAETMLERMVLSITATGGARYTVCSLEDEGPIGARLRRRGIEVIALGARGGAVRAVTGGVASVRRLLRERPFDLIHSCLYRSHCVARLARLGIGRPIPLVSSEHCVGATRSRLTLLGNRLTAGLSDRIHAVSRAVGDAVVLRDRIAAGRVRVVVNGIDPPAPVPGARRRLRRALGIADGELILLTIGRLHREKGADVLLRALPQVAPDGAFPFRAIVVGDGPERGALEAQARRLGLAGSVFFAGERRRVVPWLQAADLFVLPSREEGLPVAPLEAMALSLPVVATRVGGTPEVVEHGRTGLLVPPDDPAALAEALRRLALDEPARRALGRRGRIRVRGEFTIARMAERILDLYAELLEPAGPARLAAGEDRVLQASGS